MDDQSIRIEVGGNHIVQNMIQWEKSQALLRDAVKRIVGEDRNIVLTTRAEASMPGARQKKKQIEDERKNRALNHPLVADAIEIFDGTLMDVKLR